VHRVQLVYTKGMHGLLCVRSTLANAKQEEVLITGYYMKKVPLLPVTWETAIWPRQCKIVNSVPILLIFHARICLTQRIQNIEEACSENLLDLKLLCK